MIDERKQARKAILAAIEDAGTLTIPELVTRTSLRLGLVGATVTNLRKDREIMSDDTWQDPKIPYRWRLATAEERQPPGRLR